MQVAGLQLRDFRSYCAAEIRLEPGICVFLGSNGFGKTNLIEAVGYTANLASHRVANDTPLIRQGAQSAIIRTEVLHVTNSEPPQSTLVELELAPGRANRARINRAPASKPKDVLGILRTVIFAPEDLALVKGDPAERRKFMDDLLVARAPRFSAVRQDYERVLRQRSTLLKSARQDRSGTHLASLAVWDEHLARTGAALLMGRLRLVAQLAEPLCLAYRQVSGGQGDIAVHYKSNLGPDLISDIAQDPDWGRAQLQQRIAAAAVEHRQAELDRGICLVGPHRDDLQLSIGAFPAKGYASHGESWSLALGLKLASYEILRTEVGGDPVLILDDVFAELDQGRRGRLAQLVATAEQVMVTAAVSDDVPGQLGGARYRVEPGRVEISD